MPQDMRMAISPQRVIRYSSCLVLAHCQYLVLYSALLSCLDYCFYSLIFTARCTLCIAIACPLSVRLSVRLSVCDVGELRSHRLEFFKNNFTNS